MQTDNFTQNYNQYELVSNKQQMDSHITQMLTGPERTEATSLLIQ